MLRVTLLLIMMLCSSCLTSRLIKEHDEARNLPIASVDFKQIPDGLYRGDYPGGMYEWRSSTVEVSVDGGRVTTITLIDSADPGAANSNHQELFSRIITEQSLDVDAISGATLTSRAYLKAVEIALLSRKDTL